MDEQSELMKIAAEMAMFKGMPSKDHRDWRFTKGLQVTNWRLVFDAADKAEKQCKQWAIRLRKIADMKK